MGGVELTSELVGCPEIVVVDEGDPVSVCHLRAVVPAGAHTPWSVVMEEPHARFAHTSDHIGGVVS